MANGNHSSGVAALDQNLEDKDKEIRTNSLLLNNNSLYGIVGNAALLALMSLAVASIQFTIVTYAQSFFLLIAISLLIELGFISLLRNLKTKPADFGFVHDLFWAATAPLIAIYAREGFNLAAAEVSGSLVYVAVSFLVAVFVFPLFSMRHELWEFTALSDLRRVGGAVLLSVVVVSFLTFIANRHDGVARTVPLLHFLFLFVPLVGARICYRYFRHSDDNTWGLGSATKKSSLSDPAEHVLIIGVNRLSDFYIQAVEELGDGSVEISGILHDEKRKCAGHIRSIPILGSTDDLGKQLHDLDVRGVHVDRIVLCCAWCDLSDNGRSAIFECRADRSIQIDHFEDRVDSLNKVLGFRRANTPPQPEFSDLTGTKHADTTHENDLAQISDQGPADVLTEISSYFAYKRAFDTLAAAGLLLILSPIMLIVGLLVNLFIGFPGIFWQKRPGRYGQIFRIYKFRSMLAPFDSEGNRIPEEERTTTFCRILRRSRLDELPQLYNILVGHMSLVGPRPLLPIDQPENAELRLLIRPGVTGWAQVNGGISLTPEEKLALDLWYARHASVLLDIKIIIKSVVMIIRGDRKDEDAIGKAMLEMSRGRLGAIQHG